MDWLLLVIGVVAIGSFALWWPRRGDPDQRASLGSSLVTGAVLSLAFFYLQDENEKSDKAISDRQALRVTIGSQRDLRSADLSGQPLSRFDLSGKDLSGADLGDATLTEATLRATKLVGARLVGTRLDKAQLPRADLSGALMNGVDLDHAVLTGANLAHAALGQGADGKGADLEGAYLVDAHLQGACLAHANLRHATLGGADLRGAVLTGADLTGAVLIRDGLPANFDRASLKGVVIDAANRPRLPVATPPVPEPVPAPAAAGEDEIVEVSDGDTVRFRDLGWVRLIGIDAPDDKQPVGQRSRMFVKNTITRAPAVRYRLGQVRVESRAGTVGRSRAYAWLADGRFLNGALLDGGYATRQHGQPEDADLAQPLDDAEARARAAGHGVWDTCRQE